MIRPEAANRKLQALKALELWRAAEPHTLQFIGDSANHIYSFCASGRRYFLRLTSSSSRTLEQVKAELDFVSYLKSNSVSVSLPVESACGRTVEVIQSVDEPLYACVFEEAAGESFSFGSAEANERNFHLRGKTLGRIHELSRNYHPRGHNRRFSWDKDVVWRNVEHYLPLTEKAVWAEYRELMEYLSAYPKEKDSFGLIHGDFGSTNFRCQGDTLTVFDFDDSCYHWYLYDIAIVIYPHGSRPDASSLLGSFLEGYAKASGWDTRWLNEFTLFCRLRLLYMFLHYAQRWGFSNLTREQSEWFARKRENIARGYILSI